ncbi:alpha/beta-hydrolase [Hesseltinella vesiculosa]|uniref:Alpha/beta-hydrolase n=1 Tax=Hesseltinella vesiculosa TaxID=101127 RepID=A0A1X2GGA9_9FUNG|nr:alpha/beta-hydrolase [Hesseltinella vesiculosa]
MLDHLVGKPSPNWKRTQIILTLLLGSFIVAKGDTSRLPNVLQRLNKRTVGVAPWKVTLSAWMIYYLLRNLFHLIGLNAPEPLARLYKRSFYRATWILTALDAGFFTAMPLRPTWLRHICSVLFSLYYLMFADDAEEKVRRVRATMSVEQMRLSWEKASANPILSFMSALIRPGMTVRRILSLPRPSYRASLPNTEVYLFYAGDPATLKDQTTILLQFPGGGFVSMPPACHEDAIAAWATQTGLPILSINYKKAPEFPYPYAIEECFDVYVTLIRDHGKQFGLSGDNNLNIIVLGDSAGGNVTTAVTLQILTHNEQVKRHRSSTGYLLSPTPTSNYAAEPLFDDILPAPCGLILIYPALDFEMSCWMHPDQLSMIRAESKTQLFRSTSLESLWHSKDHFNHVSPLSVVPDIEKKSVWRRFKNTFGMTPLEGADGNTKRQLARPPVKRKPTIRERVHEFSPNNKQAWENSSLAMTSRMSFFNDRILTPDMMRAMAILYLGPHATPDFESDYLLSPVVAPFDLLAQFPKTYMICGEKDPFVDDTVIFASRIRQAKAQHGMVEDDVVRVKFLEGMSHAFFQMMAFLPEAHRAAKTVGAWIQEIADEAGMESDPASRTISPELPQSASHHVAQLLTSEKEMMHRRKTQLVDELYK